MSLSSTHIWLGVVSHPCRLQGYAGGGWWAGVPRGGGRP